MLRTPSQPHRGDSRARAQLSYSGAAGADANARRYDAASGTAAGAGAAASEALLSPLPLLPVSMSTTGAASLPTSTVLLSPRRSSRARAPRSLQNIKNISTTPLSASDCWAAPSLPHFLTLTAAMCVACMPRKEIEGGKACHRAMQRQHPQISAS